MPGNTGKALANLDKDALQLIQPEITVGSRWRAHADERDIRPIQNGASRDTMLFTFRSSLSIPMTVCPGRAGHAAVTLPP